MSGSSILFDAPGPKALARYRTYSVVSAVALLALVGVFVWQMQRTGQFAYAKWEYFVTPKYLQAILVDGVFATVRMAVFAILGALVIGLAFGVGKLSDHGWVRWPCWAFVEFFRAVPLLLLIIYIYYAVGTGGRIGPFWSVILGLALYNGAVLAEVFRAGINAVPYGQSEAAYAIGMRKTQVMSIVMLPQAVKIMLPAIISQFVVALKDTSLGYAIVAPGLTVVFKQLWGEGRNEVQAVMVLAALYIALNLILSALATMVQRRVVGTEAKPMGTGMDTGANTGV